MEPNHCKVYIHDLSIKQEAKARRQIVMSGAEHATNVRFVQNLYEADIWILVENSAFFAYAQKYRTESRDILLWLSKAEQLLDATKKHFFQLTNVDIARHIDAIIDPTKNPLSSKEQTTIIAHVIPEVAKHINSGMRKKQGSLCIGYEQAIFYFDFAQLTVKYNNAGYDALWTDNHSKVSLNNLAVFSKVPDNAELSKGCSAFSAIWQMTHRLQDQKVYQLLINNHVLALHTWPPFEQVKHQFDDYRIASLLQKKPLNAQQVSHLLGIEESRVYMFFSAIYLCASGIFENKTADNLKSVTKKNHTLAGLWRRVRDTVGV